MVQLLADQFALGVDSNANTAGNTHRFQLSATAPHHREVVSRGGRQAFIQPSDGCTDAEASLVGTYHVDAWDISCECLPTA